jgi:hypothetical protein
MRHSTRQRRATFGALGPKRGDAKQDKRGPIHGISRFGSCVFAAATTVLLIWSSLSAPKAAETDPFNVLLGSWRGSGYFRLQDGTSERIQCNTYYTGGGSQLGMAIRCQSASSKIEIRSKLSKSGSRISGSWEERTYNASGSAAGSATGDKISLQISGGVTGTMLVAYTGSRQNVSISTQGIPLKSVSITLMRS